jgi:hypothetical protein
MKLSKDIVGRAEALKISKDYVAFVEGDHDKFEVIIGPFEKLRRGQAVLTYSDGQFVMAKVSSIDHKSFAAIDGPVVRVSNSECSWRVDGNRYACPVKVGA